MNAACGLITGGGASITLAPDAGFFFVLAVEKNDPKKLGSSFFASTSRSRLLLIVPGASLPDFGSAPGGGGRAAASRSFTMAIARCPLRKSGCVVLT